MAKIMDDFGYIIKIPEEEMKAIHLVDNGINPYKKIRNKSLQNKVRSEYKRRLIINIVGLIVKSPSFVPMAIARSVSLARSLVFFPPKPPI